MALHLDDQECGWSVLAGEGFQNSQPDRSITLKRRRIEAFNRANCLNLTSSHLTLNIHHSRASVYIGMNRCFIVPLALAGLLVVGCEQQPAGRSSEQSASSPTPPPTATPAATASPLNTPSPTATPEPQSSPAATANRPHRLRLQRRSLNPARQRAQNRPHRLQLQRRSLNPARQRPQNRPHRLQLQRRSLNPARQRPPKRLRPPRCLLPQQLRMRSTFTRLFSISCRLRCPTDIEQPVCQ